MAIRGWLVALLMAVAATAAAHKPSDSYLTLETSGRSLSGQWDIALRDLDFALGLDGNGDGAITWGEVRARHAAIAAYALERLAVRSGGECRLDVAGHMIDQHSDGAYAVLKLAGTCPAAGEPLQVTYNLLFDADAQHRGLGRLSHGGTTHSAIFSADSRVQSFQGPAASPWTTFTSFAIDGMKHIAIGFDHLLFLVVLLLPAVLVRTPQGWRPAAGLRTILLAVAGIVTAFTIAHSVTLSLAALQMVQVPSRWVESLIAASIALTALDNIIPFLPKRRWVVAFVFGLVHGLGFASVLLDLGLPRGALALSLLGFNAGVEVAQLALVLAVVPLAFLARKRESFGGVLRAGSAVAAVTAVGWLAERALLLSFMPF